MVPPFDLKKYISIQPRTKRREDVIFSARSISIDRKQNKFLSLNTIQKAMSLCLVTTPACKNPKACQLLSRRKLALSYSLHHCEIELPQMKKTSSNGSNFVRLPISLPLPLSQKHNTSRAQTADNLCRNVREEKAKRKGKSKRRESPHSAT